LIAGRLRRNCDIFGTWAPIHNDNLKEEEDAGRITQYQQLHDATQQGTHMAEDLGKSTLHESDLSDESKKRLKVLSLTDNAGWLMAVGNDLAYDQIFVQQLMNYGQPGDVLLAISGSGNSPNVLNAVDWANRHEMKTFGLTGYGGGKLKEMQQDGLHVALDDMGMVESIHLCLFHWVLNDVFARINSEGRYAA
jgi:D-sedoheptulose 7-phosphate isomerase